MSDFADKLLKLRERCFRCFANEVSDIFPQNLNKNIMAIEMKQRGNPEHTSMCPQADTTQKILEGES